MSKQKTITLISRPKDDHLAELTTEELQRIGELTSL